MRKKHVLLKEFFREIKRSRNRFLSILLIVMLGVAFFSGVRAASPDMELSADVYYDDAKLMDIRILGDMGITEEDVTALRDLSITEDIEPSYSQDVLCTKGDTQHVFKLMSTPEKMNRIHVTKGRLPESREECLIDAEYAKKDGFGIGDTFSVTSGNDNDIADTLAVTDFTITGYGTSPYYLSLERGTSSIGDGNMNAFVIVPPEAFSLEVYTEVCLRIKDTSVLACYGDAYKDQIDDAMDEIEKLSDGRCEIRYAGVTADGQQKIDDSKKDLRDAKQKISDARKQLADAKKELDDGDSKLQSGKSELAEKEQELADGQKQIEDSEAQLADGRAQLDDGYAQLQASYDQLTDGQAQIDAAYQTLAEKQQELDAGRAQLESAKQTIADGQNQLDAAVGELATGQAQLESGRQSFDEAQTQAEQAQGQIAALAAAAQAGDETAAAQLAAAQDMLKKGEAQMAAAQAALDEGTQKTEKAQETISRKQAEIDAASAQIAGQEQTIADSQGQINDGYAQLEQKKAELSSGWEQYNSAAALLDEKSAELADGEAALQNAREELADGRKQLDEARGKLTDSEKELAEGKQEYEEKKTDADKEISDGEKDISEGEEKLSDAQKELDDLEVPTWYVLSRESIQTYVEYEQNADRIAAIGKVFPSIFFLVAALICLTTMTRMVEENRIQIGTLKALGYKNSAIAAKYIGYAFFATLLGSLIGLVLGQKLLPYVIIKAYGILYNNLPDVLTPLHFTYSFAATALALACTILATLFSCWRDTLEVPAQLMRPEAPKKGKRVLLERVGFIWKHLNFSNKATVRNLMRYKKRFFMTIFGIGACMGLLLVGFGLKDSIMAIGDLQYSQLHVYQSCIYLDPDSDEVQRDKVYAQLDADKDIESYMKVSNTSIDVEKDGVKKSSYLLVLSDPDRVSTYIRLRDRLTKEKYELNDDGVIISEKLASLLDVKAGDTIALKESDTHSVDVKISHVVENYFYHYIYMTPALYEKVYGEPCDFKEIFTVEQKDDEAFEKQMQKTYMKDKAVASVYFVSKTSSRIADMLKSMDTIIVVIVVSAGLLAFIVLYNLNNINISERRRELATLKVLGFYESEVSMYVFRENIWLTLIGCLLGIGIGGILHRFVIITAEVDMMMFGRDIKPFSYLYSIGFTLLFSVLVNIVMHFKLKKLDMVESMKSVE